MVLGVDDVGKGPGDFIQPFGVHRSQMILWLERDDGGIQVEGAQVPPDVRITSPGSDDVAEPWVEPGSAPVARRGAPRPGRAP